MSANSNKQSIANHNKRTDFRSDELLKKPKGSQLSCYGSGEDYGTNDTLQLLQKIPNEEVETNLDGVLAAVKIIDNLCKYQGCKTKTSLMGQNCDLCRQRYCFKHGLPEVHGCGEAVKRDERNKFLHPKPLQKIRKEEETAHARKKLDSKLKDMQVSRMKKGAREKAAEIKGHGSKKS